MALSPVRILRRGNGPVVAAAIHGGHDTRPGIDTSLALTVDERLREEDAFTAEWTQIAKIQIVALRSRFEVDLNRPRHASVYRSPQDAWGLKVWKSAPNARLIQASLREYDVFYASVQKLLQELVAQHKLVAVYDLHSYNHRRGGPDAPPAEPIRNPEVNVGTGTINRAYWSPIVDRFIQDLSKYDFHGRTLDVRENVAFRGGHFGRWIAQTFPYSVCPLAIEIKKFYVDEWTGEGNWDAIESVYNALVSTLPGVEQALLRMKHREH